MSQAVIAKIDEVTKTLLDEIASLKTQLAEVQERQVKHDSNWKAALKLVRAIKRWQDDPSGEKAKARSANNGFNKEVKVSPELFSFLGKTEGDSVCRAEVTKYINKYINEKDLKDPTDKRQIILDKTLSKLLDPPQGEPVTFLNLQKFLAKHYLKEQ